MHDQNDNEHVMHDTEHIVHGIVHYMVQTCVLCDTDIVHGTAFLIDVISELTHYMEVWFSGTKQSICDKLTCVMCFDMPGTGKATMIMEASKKLGSIFCHISLINNPLFIELFSFCQKFGEKQDPP